MCLSILVGASLGAGVYLIAAPFAVALPAVLLLMRPGLCLVAMAGFTLVIAGSLKFFLGLGQFQWAISALGMMLLLIALVKTAFAVHGARPRAGTGVGTIFMLWWLMLVVASLANMTPMLNWFVGIRIFLPYLGVFAYIAYCRPSERLLKGLLLFLLAIASIQWVFCVYQKFVVVPARIGGGYPGSPWDSVVGTFGGEKFGGGESGSLGVYLTVALTIAAALYRNRQMRGWVFALLLLTGFASVALSESKVVVLLLPLGALLVYRDYAYKRPLRFLLGGFAMLGVVLALLFGYHAMYWQSQSRLGFLDSLVLRLSYSFDPDFRVTSSNLGRIGSLVYWWDHHALLENPLTLLLGHGLASAVGASTLIGVGTAVREHGYLLDTTGATKLLWESGLLGFAALVAVFAVGFWRAWQLAQAAALPAWHRAAMKGAEAAMVLMPLSIFYEVTVVSSPPMQFTAMLLLGYVAYWWRESGSGGQR